MRLFPRKSAERSVREGGAGARLEDRPVAARHGIVTSHGAGREMTSSLCTVASGLRECCSRACGGLRAAVAAPVVLFFASQPPFPGTMATDSWALAVDEQEAAVKSMSSLQIKEEKVKPDTNGVIKANATPEKTDEEEKGNYSLKPCSKRCYIIQDMPLWSQRYS